MFLFLSYYSDMFRSQFLAIFKELTSLCSLSASTYLANCFFFTFTIKIIVKVLLKHKNA